MALRPNYTDTGGAGVPVALEMRDDPRGGTDPSPQQGDETPADRRSGRPVSERSV